MQKTLKMKMILGEENDDSQDGDYKEPKETRYEYERDLDSDERFQAIDDEELEELLADEHVVDCRKEDVEELVTEVAEEAEPEEEEPVEETVEESNTTNSIQDTKNTGVAEQDEPSERPTRNVQEPDRMTYTRFGSPNPKRNFVQKQSIGVLERKHNLLTQVSPSPENDFEYTPHEAVLLARYMQHLNTINLETGWSLANNTCLREE